jgi:hypothetical protein
MIVKRHALALLALSFGLVVGACAQVSGSVSDAWPHWAGGEPAGTPPRPGTPGYENFIAHRQAADTAGQQQPPAATGSTTTVPAPAVAVNPAAPAPQSPPPANNTVARGNLY